MLAGPGPAPLNAAWPSSPASVVQPPTAPLAAACYRPSRQDTGSIRAPSGQTQDLKQNTTHGASPDLKTRSLAAVTLQTASPSRTTKRPSPTPSTPRTHPIEPVDLADVVTVLLSPMLQPPPASYPTPVAALLQRAHHRLLTGGCCSCALIACVASRSFLTENGVSPTAWRHTHPTRLDRLRHWAARRLAPPADRRPAWPSPVPPRGTGEHRTGRPAARTTPTASEKETPFSRKRRPS